MIIAVIPARGGSKRLPRKNVLPFAGRPLIAHTIALAKAAPGIARCIVSTEDPEIAGLARSYGAEVIDRPAELASDQATTASAIIHAVRTIEAAGTRPEAVVTLQPNCPCRPLDLLERGLELFQAHDADSVVSVTASTRKLGTITDGFFTPNYTPGMRSQDMQRSYFENGLLYITRVDMLLETGSLFGSRILPLETDELSALGDIDTPLDFTVAEFLFQQHRHHFRVGSSDDAAAVTTPDPEPIEAAR